MSKVSKFCGLGPNPGYDPEAESKHRNALLAKLSFTPKAWLDSRQDLHFGYGIPSDLPRWQA